MKVTTDGCLFGAWVVERVKRLESEVNNCLDIGTGTGLLSLMLAQQNNFPIDALEIDANAAVQAKENIIASPWKEQIRVHHKNAIEFANKIPYTVIISNPPFYENELKGPDKNKDMAHHDGGIILSQLLPVIKKNLAADGVFYLLLPFKRNEEIRKLFMEQELAIQQITFVKQSLTHGYFRMMLAGRLQTTSPAETIIDEMAIKDEDGKYTLAFTNLLQDYYLHISSH